jgi:4-hydroxybenzoate polyprenyltransferase
LRITEIYFDLSYNKNLDYFVFFGTITGYNFVKYAGVAKLHHKSLTEDLKIIQIFSFFCFLALCYFAYLLPINTILFTLPFCLLTFLYAVPFLSGFHKNLRQISFLKIIVVALVWAGFTVLLPVFDSSEEITINVVFLAIQRFLLVIVLILPFDIRDVKYDAISLQTIPKRIGVEKTKKLGLALMIFSLILEYLFATESMVKTPFMIFFFLVIIFLMRAKIAQPKYYSSFLVEALPIIWWFVLLGFHNI